MSPRPRKILALYLALCTAFSPLAPVVAQASSTPVVAQQLPELGGSHTRDSRADVRTSAYPGMELSAATDPVFAPGALRVRTQGRDEAVTMGAGMLTSAASEATQSWFAARQMTAQLALKVESDGVRGGSLDVLVPFYRAGKDLLFTQMGARRADSYTESYRNTANLGVGYRRDAAGWLLGVNGFYDRDMSAGHDRLGVGLEAWTDYLKLSANSYQPLTDWKRSADQVDYLERPARGWDVRAEGYLPAYPQLGGRLMYEQYFGDQVSLFSASDRQKNPSAVTVGALYNPVPMFSMALNHRIGQGGMADTSANLAFTYRLGEPLAKQLSTGSVKAGRLLQNMRYDLVARNNEMVMDNRRDTVQLRLPESLAVPESGTVQFSVMGAKALRALTWSGTAAAFTTPYDGSEQVSLTVPAYQPSVSRFSVQSSDSAISNRYTLQAVATDKSGRAVNSNVMTVVVYSVALAVSASPATITADGSTTTRLAATLKGVDGQPVGAGLLVNWATSAGTLLESTSRTDEQGVAVARLVSATQAGTASVSASAGSATGTTSVTFSAGAPASGNNLAMQASPEQITADGVSTSTLTALVKDAHGNPVAAGVTVTWSSSAGSLASASTTTDSSGIATAVLTSATLAGAATVQARAGQAQGTISVTFAPGAVAAGSKGLALSATPASLPADGSSLSTLKAVVMDEHGNPVGAGTSVAWSTTAGVLSSPVSSTNAQGMASVQLTSATLAGLATIEASAATARNSTAVTFTAGVPAAGNSGIQLNAAPSTTTADGVSTSTLTATVKDAFGNTLPAGVQVNWTTTAGVLASAASTTNASGMATVVLTSATQAGTATIEAASGAARNSTDVTFAPGAPASGSAGLTLTATVASITADGASATTLSAKVRDVHGNPVQAGVVVNWTASAGTLAGTTSSTDANGVATVQLTSSTVAGVASITASSGVANNSTAVTFVPGAPAAGKNGLLLTVVSAAGSDTATLRASVKDGFGNRVGAGVVVSWTSTAGTLAGATSMTAADGVASMLLTNTGGTAQIATIEATAGEARDAASVAFLAGEPAVGSNGISLSVDAVNADNTADLKAVVRDAYGDAVGAGIVVNWQTDAGTLSSATSTTDANGVAHMVLSGAAGSTSQVTASTGAANNTIDVVFNPGTPAAGSSGISLAAMPPSLLADGVTTATLTATVRDAQGQSVGTGVTVNWSTSLGNLAGATSVTNAAGIASMVLTSATVAGIASVTVSSGAAHNQVNLAFTPGTPAAGNSGLELRASPAAIVADGVSTSTLQATLKDRFGNPVEAGIVVSWTTSAGALADTVSSTDANGVATMLLTSTVQTGVAAVRASAGLADNATTVTFEAGPPAAGSVGVSLNAEPASITADGSSTTTLSAVVRDTQGNTVGAGVAVRWLTSAGSLSNTSTLTDASGASTVVLTSATQAGSATVQVVAGAALNSTSVTFAPGAPAAGNAGLSLTATPTAIPADGSSTSTLRAVVSDAHGNRVGAGQVVSWSTSAGTLATASSLTDANGEASVTLTSTATLATATVAATAGAANAVLNVRFGAAALSTITVVADQSSLTADGRSTTTLSATLTDVQGNALDAGVVVNWATSSGTLASSTSMTDEHGVASMVLTSSTVAATAVIDVTVGEVKGSANVRYTVGAAAALVVSASPAQVPPIASGKTTVSALLTDSHGNPLGAGISVDWAIESDHFMGPGQLSTTRSTTDASGIATVELSGRTWQGSTTVTASAGAVTGSTSVLFALKVSFNAQSYSVPRNGQVTATVTILTPDGKPASGVPVEWKLSSIYIWEGRLSSNTGTTDSNGRASVTLISTASSTMIGSLSVNAHRDWSSELYVPVTFQ